MTLKLIYKELFFNCILSSLNSEMLNAKCHCYVLFQHCDSKQLSVELSAKRTDKILPNDQFISNNRSFLQQNVPITIPPKTLSIPLHEKNYLNSKGHFFLSPRDWWVFCWKIAHLVSRTCPSHIAANYGSFTSYLEGWINSFWKKCAYFSNYKY